MSNPNERQKVVFSQFLNSLLPEDLQIQDPNDLPKSISSGLLLLHLLDILIKQTYNREAHFVDQLNQVQNPNVYQKMENVRIALQYLGDEEGIDMVNLDAKGIVDENEKLVLGLVWRIINHFHVSRNAAKRANEEKEQLLQSYLSEDKHVEVVRELSELEKRFSDVLQWVNTTLKNAGFETQASNLTSSWKDPLLLKNLIIAIAGSESENVFVGVDGEDLIQASIDFAFEKFNVPKILSVEDFQNPDKLIISTYVAYFRDYALEQEKLLILQQNQLRESEIDNFLENSYQQAIPSFTQEQSDFDQGFQDNSVFQDNSNNVDYSNENFDDPFSNSIQESVQEVQSFDYDQNSQTTQEEPSAFVQMQRKRQQRILEASNLSKEKRQEQKSKSLELKQKIIQDRKDRIAQRHKTNIEEENRKSEYLNISSENPWEQVAKYCNFSNDAPPQPKDSQRYKSLIIQLKNKA